MTALEEPIMVSKEVTNSVLPAPVESVAGRGDALAVHTLNMGQEVVREVTLRIKHLAHNSYGSEFETPDLPLKVRCSCLSSLCSRCDMGGETGGQGPAVTVTSTRVPLVHPCTHAQREAPCAHTKLHTQALAEIKAIT